jgi:3,4-dihydroxy 2-butanone 4-phosphate synthase / GTP cyclohydrolase II
MIADETAPQGIGLDTVERAIAEIAAGRAIVVVDDASRENEGDIVFAASKATRELLAFTIRYARGLVCVPMLGEDLDRLQLPPMTSDNQEHMGTAFTISVDARDGITTGISAADRARTIRTLVDSATEPYEIVRPGHVFPLRYAEGGVLRRAGHTEAAVDLARLAGLTPAGVVAEIFNDDGTMARLPQLRAFADEHGLALISIAQLIEYRRHSELTVRRMVETRVPNQFGVWRAVGYLNSVDGTEHLALVLGDLHEPGEPPAALLPGGATSPDPSAALLSGGATSPDPSAVLLPVGATSPDPPAVLTPEGATPPDPPADILVRMHSECLTGDVFGSQRCDCGAQLAAAMAAIAAEGRGIVLYLRGHEGRGIGLLSKLRAYQLQDEGADTVDANLELGLPADAREYSTGAQMLADLGVRRLRLLTNNPAKMAGLSGFGIEVTGRVSLPVAATEDNLRYLIAKRDRLGHQLDNLFLPNGSAPGLAPSSPAAPAGPAAPAVLAPPTPEAR